MCLNSFVTLRRLQGKIYILYIRVVRVCVCVWCAVRVRVRVQGSHSER